MSLAQMQWLDCAKCGDVRMHNALGCVTCRNPHPTQVTKITNEAWLRDFCERAERARAKRKPSMSPEERRAKKNQRRRERRAAGLE